MTLALYPDDRFQIHVRSLADARKTAILEPEGKSKENRSIYFTLTL
jgi:hypothetical protein